MRHIFYQLRLYRLELFRTRAHFDRSSPPPITVCIPAFQSGPWIEETIASLEAQTLGHFHVLISVDGNDLATLEKLRPLEGNPKYTIHLQTKRLGWVGNVNWLLSHVSTPFLAILPHDDLFHPLYLELLYRHLRANLDCLLAYSDTQLIGPDPSWKGRYFVHPSVKGSRVERMEAYLLCHLNAAGFRGLMRKKALEVAGLIPEDLPGHFAADTVWLGKIAKQGEIHRIAAPLCTKRYHENNTHTKWFEGAHKKGWETSCEAILDEFLKEIDDPLEEKRLKEAAAFRVKISPHRG